MPSFPNVRRAILILAISTAAIGRTATPVPVPIVKTAEGRISGLISDGALIFRGIPFAAPPVGALRWRAPQPVAPWQDVRPAATFAPRCTQPPVSAAEKAKAQPESEDCLYLNVTRPAGDARNLPVLFWIPGGGLVAGAGSDPRFDGHRFAAKDVVLVTINYRVGRFGFFAHPDLTRENADGGRLYNYGLMDQIAALRWVRRNIAAFGGDPARVTIFGVSAGGASVDALMISPEARGLFAAAVSESGYGRGAYLRISERSGDGDAPAEAIGTRIAARLNMADATIGQLRAVPAERIQALFDYNDDHMFAVDGKVLLSDPWPAFARHEEAPVPFIVGSNSYEQGPMDPAQQRPWAEKVVPAANWEQLTPYYADAPERDRLLLGDIIFTTQSRALAARHVRNGHPAYLYMFDVPTLYQGRMLPGALHGAEVRYVFGNLDLPAQTAPDTKDQRVSQEIMGYWTSLAKTGDPNSPGLPAWPVYRNDMLLHIGSERTIAAIDPFVARVAAVNRASTDMLPE